MKELELRNRFGTVGRGRFVVCAPTFDFLWGRLGEATSELKIRKLHNFRDFSAISGDRINQ